MRPAALFAPLAIVVFLRLPVFAADDVSYHRDVWPILKRHCWSCHSGQEPKGALRMDRVADLLKGGESGPSLVAGQPDKSLLVESITGPKPEMPPKQPPLAAAKIDLIRAWIKAGAKDDAPAEPPAPVVKIPETYAFPPAVVSLSFSPDGKLLAAACRSEVALIDLEAAEDAAPRRIPTESELLTHVEFRGDGQLLAAAGGWPGRHGAVQFIEPATGKVASSRRIGFDTLFRGSFSPDGQTLALGGADGAVHLIPVAADQPLRKFDLHSDWCLDAAFTPDGKLLCSVGRDKVTKVTEVETGALLRAVDTSTELVAAVAADDKTVISAGRAKTLIAYDLGVALSGIEFTARGGNGARPNTRRDQYVRPMENQPGEVLDLAVTPDRKLLATAGAFADVRLYNLQTRQRTAALSKVPAPATAVALSADGARVAVGTQSGQVLLFSAADGKLLRTIAPVPVASAGETRAAN